MELCEGEQEIIEDIEDQLDSIEENIRVLKERLEKIREIVKNPKDTFGKCSYCSQETDDPAKFSVKCIA